MSISISILHLILRKKGLIVKQVQLKINKKSKISVAMQKWLPWEIVSNHLGQEMKQHKSILYDNFMHLYIENMKY